MLHMTDVEKCPSLSKNNVCNLWCFVAKYVFCNLHCFVMKSFCRDLRAIAWRKFEPKIVPVEKQGQISGMLTQYVSLTARR